MTAPDSGGEEEGPRSTAERETQAEEGESAEAETERQFTCSVCGFPMAHGAGQRQVEIRSTCHNCGDWTLQVAETSAMVDDARTVAERLAGEVLTERQALAYLLREVIGADRGTAADAMDSTPSNVDNLHRRATEKIEDARRVVAELDGIEAGDG